MKKGTFTIIVLAVTCLSFVIAGTLIAADLTDEIVIEHDSYKKDKKGPVKLSHKKHVEEYKAACDACHHEYEDGKNVWTEKDPVKKCIECHDSAESKDKVKKLQIAFHKNCKSCHKEANKDGKEAPEKKCNDCHEKKS